MKTTNRSSKTNTKNKKAENVLAVTPHFSLSIPFNRKPSTANAAVDGFFFPKR